VIAQGGGLAVGGDLAVGAVGREKKRGLGEMRKRERQRQRRSSRGGFRGRLSGLSSNHLEN
jgi:hypothetical protein